MWFILFGNSCRGSLLYYWPNGPRSIGSRRHQHVKAGSLHDITPVKLGRLCLRELRELRKTKPDWSLSYGRALYVFNLKFETRDNKSFFLLATRWEINNLDDTHLTIVITALFLTPLVTSGHYGQLCLCQREDEGDCIHSKSGSSWIPESAN